MVSLMVEMWVDSLESWKVVEMVGMLVDEKVDKMVESLVVSLVVSMAR